MNTKPFKIEYLVNGEMDFVEIRPCCDQNKPGDYAVWQNDKLLFTVTKKNIDGQGWVVGMKNADKNVNENLVRLIGERIDQRYNA